jgi:hypothetical protein
LADWPRTVDEQRQLKEKVLAGRATSEEVSLHEAVRARNRLLGSRTHAELSQILAIVDWRREDRHLRRFERRLSAFCLPVRRAQHGRTSRSRRVRSASSRARSPGRSTSADDPDLGDRPARGAS